jgi:PAS domain S-box-containing protein
VLPPQRTPARQEAAAGPAAYLGALHRPTPATVALLAVALLGPPLEIARPDLADLVTLCLMAMVFLLLRDARRRVRAEETIRSTAVELAGAQDTTVILAATLAGTGACLPGHRAEIVVCANGPEGPRATASTRRDQEAAAHATDMTSPAARVDRVLAGRPHLTVVSPGQSPEAAQIALGAVGEGPELTGRLGVLELLAAQASHALDRVRLSAERNRRAGEAQFRTLVRNAADVIMIVSAQGAVRFASPSARGLLGAPTATGAFVEDVFGPVNAGVVRLRLARTYAATEDPVPEYWTLDREDGRPLELEVRFADLRTDPTVGGLVLTIRDVTEQHRLRRELEYLAFHDALTGLGNGLRFGAQVEAELAQDTRIASCRTVVMVAEIDDFWNLINLRGRAAADRVLVALARRLEAITDGAARLSGATFAALAVPADHGCRDAGSLARLLQQELSRPLDLGTESVSAQLSVGAVGVAGLADADEAQRRAGLALTEAKADPCRPWRVYQPSRLEAAVDRAALHGDLAAALAGGAADRGVRHGGLAGAALAAEAADQAAPHGDLGLAAALPGEGLAMHYQPIVDLASGTVSGFEALARWRHPERGSIPPNRFVALAEETGLIVPLGRWALRRATADLARLRALTGASAGLRMAVNVSPLQLSEPDFPSEVAAVIEESGVPAEALCLEITESSVLDQSGRALEVLRELKAMGLSLAIDDFGTGHSALSYLPDLPFDSLKIDRSFITTIATSPSRAEVVRGIVRIAGAVGMRVVAEGIEAGRQQDLLVEASCDYGQGYLYSTPVPVDEAKALLGRNWPTTTATKLGRLAGQLAAESARRPIAGVA